MKTIIVVLLSLGLFGCSLFGGGPKRAAEVVPSCFSEGDNQELYCKSQRINESGKVVTTRCIGSKNPEALQALRGKCVEKICSEGSQTDCNVKGEFLVLEQYAELATAHLFNNEESSHSKKKVAAKERTKSKVARTKAKSEAVLTPAADEATTVAMVTPPAASMVDAADPMQDPMPDPAVAAAAAKAALKNAEQPAETPMNLVLKPISSSKSRTPASVTGLERFKKVCVEKGDIGAPKILRGKCATRTCADGKCVYKGRKEMFDWASR